VKQIAPAFRAGGWFPADNFKKKVICIGQMPKHPHRVISAGYRLMAIFFEWDSLNHPGERCAREIQCRQTGIYRRMCHDVLLLGDACPLIFNEST
jgi:hypothetical protein